jgi:hypothetical protein
LKGQRQIAELLLLRGAHVGARDDGGYGALETFIVTSYDSSSMGCGVHSTCLLAKLQHTPCGPITTTALACEGTCTRVLLCSAYRWTSLHFAAKLGLREIAELLLLHGADVNAADELEYAPHVAILLAESTPRRLKRFAIGSLTALHTAAANEQYELVRLLVANGASVTVNDIDGCGLNCVRWLHT